MHERIITAGRVKGNRPEGMTSRRSPAGDRSHVADRLEFETPVYCTDGKLGELADVVIAPRSMRVVDLVVRPRHMGGPARLVPIEAAEGSAWDESIHLTCSMDEASGFPAIQEAAVMRLGEVPSGDSAWDVGVEDVIAVPAGSSMDMAPTLDGMDPLMEVVYDRIPKGKVELRHQSSVVSSDGHLVGKVDAFVVDGDEISHVILERGHIWGRRDVTIPISCLARLETDQVVLGISRHEVGALPSVRIHRTWFG
jgi:sporulation protein YlmC with PRC-barrel domain